MCESYMSSSDLHPGLLQYSRTTGQVFLEYVRAHTTDKFLGQIRLSEDYGLWEMRSSLILN